MTEETNQPPHHSVDATDESSSTTIVASSSAALLLEHTLEPGDHVIRWEMLPIVYPIQIHGIVLETGPDHVQIADFGLTTHAVHKEEEEEPNATTETTNQKPILDDAFSQKVEDVVAKAREKLRPKEKRRLHVVTIREQKELNSWKKVNYGGNLLFGGGAEGGNSKSWWNWGSKTAAETPPEDEAASCSSGDVMATSTTAEASSKIVTAEDNTDQQQQSLLSAAETSKFRTAKDNTDQPLPSAASLAKHDMNSETEQNASENKPLLSVDTEASGNHDDKPKTIEKPIAEANMLDSSKSKTIEEQIAEANMVDRCSPRDKVVCSPTTSSSEDRSSSPQQQSSSSVLASWLPRSTSMYDFKTTASEKGGDMLQKTGSFFASLRKSTSLDEGGTERTTTTALKERRMNPAMSNLLAKQQQQPPKQPPPKLPKSDPTKLVLARTRFLLEHGEAVLPPYHVFYSNSECIAVFCKTGVWSTLQASVFLHSTAIGNAKSATAITLGVSAAAPLLAPAIAGLGIAVVGMPWLILKKSKTKWEEAERTLTDLFWAQAEPQVFVECIEKWSQL